MSTCSKCRQSYCELTEGDVFYHDAICEFLQKIQSLKQQLADADKVIEFYASFMNYNNSTTSGLVTNIDATDSELLPYADIQFQYGGKRAREYKSKYKVGE